MKQEIRSMRPSASSAASRLLLVALATFLLLSAFSHARADYPIVSQRYAADPTGLEFNGRLYLYCSNDDDNGKMAGHAAGLGQCGFNFLPVIQIGLKLTYSSAHA